MSELHTGMVIIISVQVVMFVLMRMFYGAWAWEYEKTWRALKPRRPLKAHEVLSDSEIDELFPADDGKITGWTKQGPSYLTVEIPKPFPALEIVSDQNADSFDREQENSKPNAV